MQRRAFLQLGCTLSLSSTLRAALHGGTLDAAVQVLAEATRSGQVTAATLFVSRRGETLSRAFGQATSDQAMFLLGSITKPLCMTAVMTLFDRREFQLDDPLRKFLPEFAGTGRDRVTLRHLLTHTSGLPDQLPGNDALRRRHAGLDEFVAETVRVPLAFTPGTKYQYSSMGILLAAHVAGRLAGESILQLVDRTVFQPLEMKHSALGLGRFELSDFVLCQTEHAAPEAGGGDPQARDWDWNSPYWRKLGAPWGGGHASAPDLGRWLGEFLFARGAVLKPETAALMIRNHNPQGITPRGLGFGVGTAAGSPGCSEQTFGHTGSTGTLCWADSATETICVVLTSLPGRAVQPHPREVAAERVSEAVN